MNQRNQREMLKEIAAEFKAMTSEQKKTALSEAQTSHWGQTFKQLEEAGYELVFQPPDPAIQQTKDLDAVFGRLRAMSPEQLSAELAKYKDDPTARTLRMLNDPETYFSDPNNFPQSTHSTEEKHHGQENPQAG